MTNKFSEASLAGYFGAKIIRPDWDTNTKPQLVGEFNEIAPESFVVKDLARWITALRSGQYSQTRGKLKKDSGYCCLGVYADCVYSPEWALDYPDGDVYKFELDGQKYMYQIPWISDVLQGVLSVVNDRGSTFEQIAHFLESECVEA